MKRGETVPPDVCKKIIRACRTATKSAVAARFGISRNTLNNLLKRKQVTGSFATTPRGRKPSLGPDDLLVLKQLALAHPTLSWKQLREELSSLLKRKISKNSLHLALKKLNLFKRAPYKKRAANKAATPITVEIKQPRKYNTKPIIRNRYPSDMNDKEWEIAQEFFLRSKGRIPTNNRRDVLDAIFYVSRSGCQWRMLPKEFPHWKSVYTCFSRWKKDGTWEKLAEALRKRYRKEIGKNEEPSAGSVDSQSAKTTEKGGPKVLMVTKK